MIPKKNITVLFAIFALILFATISLADDRIDLKLRLQEGKFYNIMVVTEQNITQGLEGQQQSVKQNIGFGYSFNVLKVEPNGDASVKVSFHSVYIDHKGPDGNFEYDSTKPPEKIDNPAIEIMSSLVGLNFEMKMSPNGSISEIKGTDDMVNKIVSKLESA
jgi:hypothetical protein